MKKVVYRIIHHSVFQRQTVVQATLMIAIITFLSKFIGYAREMLIAMYFGATGVIDAYLIGQQIPALLIGLFAGGFGTLIIPLYITKKQENIVDAKRYVNQILIVWSLIILIVSLLSAIFAPFLVRTIAYGFVGERFYLAVQITRILSLYGFLNVLMSFFVGLLQAEKQFLIPVISASFFNTVNVIIIWLCSRIYGVYSLVIGTYVMVIGNCFIYIYLLVFKYKLIQFRKFSINWNEIKEFLFLLTPLLLSAGVGSLNQIVDRTIASSLTEGSIAALQYSMKIWTLPITLFAGVIAITAFPTFSELASDKTRLVEYKRSINKTIISFLYFMVPSSILLIIFSTPIIQLFYQRGAFNAQATTITSYVNQLYCIGLFFMAMYPILMKVFYSFKNTITPLIISVCLVMTNIVGNIILARYMEAGGIALSTTISNIVGYGVAYLFLAKYFYKKDLNKEKTGENLALEGFKIFVSIIPMGLIGLLLYRWFQYPSSFIFQALKLGLVAIILFTIFYFTSALLKTKGYEIAHGYILRVARFIHVLK